MVITIVILSIIVVVLLFVVLTASHATQRLIREIKYQENIIEAKNEALSYYVEAYQEKFDELMDLKVAIATKKPVGRPKGSKNKVTKSKVTKPRVRFDGITLSSELAKEVAKFDKKKFNDKYGK